MNGKSFIMNDFTKEELESISNWADVYCDFGLCWTYKLHKPLIDKIKAMIDNYGEQECQDIRDVNCIGSCPKCGKHHE